MRSKKSKKPKEPKTPKFDWKNMTEKETEELAKEMKAKIRKLVKVYPDEASLSAAEAPRETRRERKKRIRLMIEKSNEGFVAGLNPRVETTRLNQQAKVQKKQKKKGKVSQREINWLRSESRRAGNGDGLDVAISDQIATPQTNTTDIDYNAFLKEYPSNWLHIIEAGGSSLNHVKA